MSDDMFEQAYADGQAALDEILGAEEEDGAGGGLVADIWLVAEQRDAARQLAKSLDTALIARNTSADLLSSELIAATARAERAEAEVTRLRALADDPGTNPYWRLRSERAEAALAVYREDAAEAVAALALIVAERDTAVIANTELRRQVDAVRALAAEWSGQGSDAWVYFNDAAVEVFAELDPTDTEGQSRD